MENKIRQLVDCFYENFDVNKLLRDIEELLFGEEKGKCCHMRIAVKNEYKLVGSCEWAHNIVPKTRYNEQTDPSTPVSSSSLVASIKSPIILDIKIDRYTSYRELIEKNEKMFSKRIPQEDLRIKDPSKNIDDDFSQLFDKALEHGASHICILPIVSKEICLAIIHVFSEREISQENILIIPELIKSLSLPVTLFKKHYEKEDSLLNFSLELNKKLFNKEAEDVINFIVDSTSEFFKVDECYLSLIYKKKHGKEKIYKKHIRVVGSKNIKEANITKRSKEIEEELSISGKDIYQFKKELGLDQKPSKEWADPIDKLDNLLSEIFEKVTLAVPLEESQEVVLKRSDNLNERYGLRRLCAITNEIIIYCTRVPDKQKRKIDFYSMSEGSFFTDDEIQKTPIMKQAKDEISKYKSWKRFKGHLAFFKNSAMKSYNIIHAPLIIGEEVIGVLTIENKLNNEGKIDILSFSDYEIEAFRRWANITSYCIENKKKDDLIEEIINKAPQGIIVSDIEGDIIKSNPRSKNILKDEGEVNNVRNVYFNKEEREKIARTLKDSFLKHEGKDAVIEGVFTKLKNTEDQKEIPVHLSASNIPYFLHNISEKENFPRFGTVGYFELEKYKSIGEIITDDLFTTLCRKGRDPEDAKTHILKRIPRILESDACILFTSKEINLSDENDFIEKEHSKITKKYEIEKHNLNKYVVTKEAAFDLKKHLEKLVACKILNYDNSIPNDIGESPKYLLIPETDERFLYEKEGLTAYSARTGTVIRLDKEKNRYPSKDGNKTGECSSVLIIPIEEPPLKDPIEFPVEIIGVLKIQREKDIPFSDIDEIIGIIIAKALSFLIVGGVSIYARQCGTKILDLINNHNYSDTWNNEAYKCINSFRNEVVKLSLGENEYNHIYNCVEKSFYELCDEILEIPENLKKLSEDFRKEERTLYGLPGYREHFIHQFHNFLAGYHVITLLKPERIVFLIKLNRLLDGKKNFEMNDKLKDFKRSLFNRKYESYKNIIDELRIELKNIKLNEDDVSALTLDDTGLELEKKNLLKQWFLATMFHDIAYYIEKMDIWLDAYVKKILDTTTKHYMSWEPIILDPNFDKYIRDYAKLLCRDEEKQRKVELLFRARVLRNKDHGVISSLLLLKKCLEKTSQENDESLCKEAALAIATHNYPVWEKDSIPSILRNYLFEMPDEYKKALEQFKKVFPISQQLRGFFEEKGYLLSEDAKIKVLKENKIWEIVNDINSYIIIAEENKKISVFLSGKIDFVNHPISFLLMYCDFIQEWGREAHRGAVLKNKVKLENLVWDDNLKQIVCTLFYPEIPKQESSEDEVKEKKLGDKTIFNEKTRKHLKDMWASWCWMGIEGPLFKIIYNIDIKTPTGDIKFKIIFPDSCGEVKED